MPKNNPQGYAKKKKPMDLKSKPKAKPKKK